MACGIVFPQRRGLTLGWRGGGRAGGQRRPGGGRAAGGRGEELQRERAARVGGRVERVEREQPVGGGDVALAVGQLQREPGQPPPDLGIVGGAVGGLEQVVAGLDQAPAPPGDGGGDEQGLGGQRVEPRAEVGLGRGVLQCGLATARRGRRGVVGLLGRQPRQRGRGDGGGGEQRGEPQQRGPRAVG